MNAVVIGCGAIGPVHMESIVKSLHADLFGVCDIQKDRADKYAAQYNCKAYYSIEEVLEDKDVGSVHICTPHYLHTPMVKAAIKADKHVVVEKPVSISMEEYSSLLQAEKEGSSKICAIVQNRENPCMKKLKETVDLESEGKLLGIFANLRWIRTKEYYESGDWRGKWQTEGGGLMINQALHTLDMIILLGGKVKNIRANISNRGIPEIEVEDTADAIIEFENGAKGIFTATNLYYTNKQLLFEFDFEKCMYRYSDGVLKRIAEDGETILATDFGDTPGKDYWGSGHYKAVGNFYESLKNGTDNYVHLKDVAETMRVLFEFYKDKDNMQRYTN